MGVAVAEHREARGRALQQRRQDRRQEVDAFLLDETADHADQRRVEVGSELQALEEQLLQAAFRSQVRRIVALRQEWVVIRRPDAVVHAVQDPDEIGPARAQHVLEPHAELRPPNLLGIRGAHRGHTIGRAHPGAQEVRAAARARVGRQHLFERRKAVFLENLVGEDPLVADVVQRQHARGGAPGLEALEHGHEGRVPVVTVQNVGSPAVGGADGDGGGREPQESAGIARVAGIDGVPGQLAEIDQENARARPAPSRVLGFLVGLDFREPERSAHALYGMPHAAWRQDASSAAAARARRGRAR